MPSICQNDAPRASTATGTGPPDNNMLSKFRERSSLRMPSYPLQCTIREIMPPVCSQQSLPPLGRTDSQNGLWSFSKRTFAGSKHFPAAAPRASTSALSEAHPPTKQRTNVEEERLQKQGPGRPPCWQRCSGGRAFIKLAEARQ